MDAGHFCHWIGQMVVSAAAILITSLCTCLIDNNDKYFKLWSMENWAVDWLCGFDGRVVNV